MSKLSPLHNSFPLSALNEDIVCASLRLLDPAHQPQTHQARLARICEVKGAESQQPVFQGAPRTASHEPENTLIPSAANKVRCKIDAFGFMLSSVFHQKNAHP